MEGNLNNAPPSESSHTTSCADTFLGSSLLGEQCVTRTVWAFLAAGIMLRLVRYLQAFPLWGDECMVAVNFLDRGYLDLIQPLDWGQICPLLFLWVELTAVKLLGFSEWSLRLFPMLCGIASLFVFHHLARRLLRGLPLVLAVAIFAVSYYLIRHGTEVKQYSLDLLVSLGLLALAVEWWHSKRTLWLWLLAAAAPLVVLASLPGVFVAGGVSLALIPSVWRLWERRTWLAYAAYHAALLASFAVMYFLFLKPHQAWALEKGVHWHYHQGFPPLTHVKGLLLWLADVHTGKMFAYPFGAGHGGSVLTSACWLIGCVILWRRGHWEWLLLLVAPFGLGLFAAALQKYPYGSNTRVMMYLAPAICLAAGLGLATALSWLRPVRFRPLAVALSVMALGGVGTASLVRDLVHPYKTDYDRQSNEFSRWFWTEMGRDAELVCVLRDLNTDLLGGECSFQPALYLCLQRLHSPRHRDGHTPALERVDARRPLRCVVYHAIGQSLNKQVYDEWMRRMRKDFSLVGVRRFPVNAAADMNYCHVYLAYDFRPRGQRTVTLAQLLGRGHAIQERQ
jgi:hypothetical protein